MSAPGKTRVRMTGRERREQLLSVGRAVFAERGFEAASIEEVAERANVSKPVVYEHFAGKEALYAVVVEGEVSVLLARIVTALREAPDPRSAVENATDAFLTYIEQHGEGFRILVRDAPIGSASGTLPTLLGDVAASAESLLAEHFEQRGYDPSLAPLYARALVGMVALVGEWWMQTGKPSRAEVAAHVVNLSWHGLRNLQKDPPIR
jgi:AcrR family transcriptional regulator